MGAAGALLTLVAIGAAGCAPWRGTHPRIEGDRPAVALVVAGTAFTRSGVASALRAALEARLHRRVVVLEPPAAGDVPALRAAAVRVARDDRALHTYRWHEPWCAAGRDVRLALRYGVDAVVHATIDWQSGPGGERLAGTIALASLTTAAPQAVRVDRRAPPRGRFTGGLPVRAVLDEAVAGLPAAGTPDWRAVARRLVQAGCPVHAAALADSRLAPGDARAVERAARSAMHATLDRAASRKAARDAGEPPAPSAAPAAPPADERYSCTTLCGMHMIELCNNDRTLWSAHRRPWEATACGVRRGDDFLQDCYRQQWLSGTFHQSCVAPCERAPDGRERLLHLLQGAGCVRSATS